MANLRVLSLVAAAALLLAPVASAQATPAAPTAALTTYAVAPESATIPLGGQAIFNITATVTFQQMICPAQAKTTLNLVMGSRGLAGVEGTLPASFELTVAANVPTPPATTPAPSTTTTATGVGQFVVKVSPSASPNHDHVFQLNATYSAGIPTGCYASTAPNDAMVPTQLQTKMVSIKTGPGAGNQTTSGPTTGTGPTGNNGTTQASPLADVPFVAILVLGVAFFASRRRRVA